MRSATARALGWTVRIAAVVLLLAAVAVALRYRERRCHDCNIILISVDTLRADHLGCYGYGRETSPAIDALARQSVFFANAYSASAWTLPGHLTMMTGRYPVKETEFAFMSARSLPESYATVAELLRAVGWTTVGFNGGGLVAPGMGFERGFDIYDMPTRNLRDLGPRLTRWFSQRQRDYPYPFFLFLHGYDVHEPYAPPEHLRLRFVDAVPEECRGIRLTCSQGDTACRQSPLGREYLISQYDASIVAVDHFVEWLVAELKRRGLHKRTILVLTADHGEALMDDGSLGCGHMGSLEESVFRVPLILHIPDSTPRRIEQRVSLVDLVPTLLDLVAIPRPEGLHGESLVPVLEGERSERHIHGITGNDPGNVVLGTIAGHDKVIQRRANAGSSWQYELYDLATDPRAKVNRMPTIGPPPPAFYATLEHLHAWTRDIGLDVAGLDTSSAQSLPPEVLDQLEALGYR